MWCNGIELTKVKKNFISLLYERVTELKQWPKVWDRRASEWAERISRTKSLSCICRFLLLTKQEMKEIIVVHDKYNTIVCIYIQYKTSLFFFLKKILTLSYPFRTFVGIVCLFDDVTVLNAFNGISNIGTQLYRKLNPNKC